MVADTFSGTEYLQDFPKLKKEELKSLAATQVASPAGGSYMPPVKFKPIPFNKIDKEGPFKGQNPHKLGFRWEAVGVNRTGPPRIVDTGGGRTYGFRGQDGKVGYVDFNTSAIKELRSRTANTPLKPQFVTGTMTGNPKDMVKAETVLEEKEKNKPGFWHSTFSGGVQAIKNIGKELSGSEGKPKKEMGDGTGNTGGAKTGFESKKKINETVEDEVIKAAQEAAKKAGEKAVRSGKNVDDQSDFSRKYFKTTWNYPAEGAYKWAKAQSVDRKEAIPPDVMLDIQVRKENEMLKQEEQMANKEKEHEFKRELKGLSTKGGVEREEARKLRELAIEEKKAERARIGAVNKTAIQDSKTQALMMKYMQGGMTPQDAKDRADREASTSMRVEIPSDLVDALRMQGSGEGVKLGGFRPQGEGLPSLMPTGAMGSGLGGSMTGQDQQDFLGELERARLRAENVRAAASSMGHRGEPPVTLSPIRGGEPQFMQKPLNMMSRFKDLKSNQSQVGQFVTGQEAQDVMRARAYAEQVRNLPVPVSPGVARQERLRVVMGRSPLPGMPMMSPMELRTRQMMGRGTTPFGASSIGGMPGQQNVMEMKARDMMGRRPMNVGVMGGQQNVMEMKARDMMGRRPMVGGMPGQQNVMEMKARGMMSRGVTPFGAPMSGNGQMEFKARSIMGRGTGFNMGPGSRDSRINEMIGKKERVVVVGDRAVVVPERSLRDDRARMMMVNVSPLHINAMRSVPRARQSVMSVPGEGPMISKEARLRSMMGKISIPVPKERTIVRKK